MLRVATDIDPHKASISMEAVAIDVCLFSVTKPGDGQINWEGRQEDDMALHHDKRLNQLNFNCGNSWWLKWTGQAGLVFLTLGLLRKIAFLVAKLCSQFHPINVIHMKCASWFDRHVNSMFGKLMLNFYFSRQYLLFCVCHVSFTWTSSIYV